MGVLGTVYITKERSTIIFKSKDFFSYNPPHTVYPMVNDRHLPPTRVTIREDDSIEGHEG